jgi:Tol biopolymer transport system component
MASPIAHSIAGAGIYWLSLRKQTKTQEWFAHKELIGLGVAIFLANLADLDLIAGAVVGRYMHSQFTHTTAFAIIVGLLAAIVAPVFKIKPFRAFWLVSLLVSSHLILDFFTRDSSYPRGIMFVWPLSDRYYISPISVLLDIWRGTPGLMFGFNNMNAALRELFLGGVFLFIVNKFRQFPVRIRTFIPYVTIIAGVLAVTLHCPLNMMAQKQMNDFWGFEDAITDSETIQGIVFSSTRSGYSNIYRIRPDGSGLARLTTAEANDSKPVWSPDGQWIAFQSDRAGKMDVWIMAADGTQQVNLTERSAANNESPAWTAGGNQIVFSSDRDGTFALYVMARNGKSIKRVTPDSTDRKILPAVSPVRGLVAYTVENSTGPGWNISLISLNRGQPVQISPEFGCRAKWSPDGQSLCYVSENPTGQSDIYIFPVKEKSQMRITHSNQYDYDPEFSPNGNQIVFSRGQNDRKTEWDLWIIDLDTGHERRVTTDGMNNRFPSWR